jgi:urate oxidase
MAQNNLAAARYGKDNIRLCKVYRDQETGVQSVVDMTICAMLEGEIGAS